MQRGRFDILGATADKDGVNFALFSSVAERVEICLFDEAGTEYARLDLPGCDGDVWHGYMPGLAVGQQYGYRVHGPFDPSRGLRCNSNKLLLDPYARKLSGEFCWHDAVFGTDNGGKLSRKDSGPYVPRSVVCPEQSDAPPGPAIPWSEAIFYEVNVRGYTMRHPAVEDTQRGKFAGLRNKEVLAYIRSLGVTSVELMPVHGFIDEHHLATRGLRNLWGYNSVSFFAPMNRYGGGDPVTEFREMVAAIHDAGLEVILDVVYNHTGEADQLGPTLCFRGIDNTAYYRLQDGDPAEYVNDTGTGNTLNADNLAVQRLIVDSLRYWTQVMGVDGFRFDLATILGRHGSGFSSQHPLLRAITDDHVLKHCKLIAEPWDPGPGGYQLGQFPQGWAEWNDRFRDAARQFWRGDADVGAEFARRLRGSADLFEHNGRLPVASINMVTSHDGFTLRDVVSYEHRHNEANGEENNDGHAHNYSCNYGVEGATEDPDVVAQRRQHQLNLLATMLLAQGTPMLLAGDELGNTQMGNNNAYAQDNDLGWLDWSGLESDPGFVKSVRELIRLRRTVPLLRLEEYLHGSGESPAGETIIRWLNPDGSERNDDEWQNSRAFTKVLSIRNRDGNCDAVAIMVNSWLEDIDFILPSIENTQDWEILFETSTVRARIGGDQTVYLPARSMALISSSCK